MRLLRSMRAAAVVFAGSGLDDPASNEEMNRHLASMRADGAAVVHLSPHALGEPEVGVDNAAGIAAMVAALVELGPPADRVPRRAVVPVRRPRAPRRVPPGLERAGLPFDERLVVRTAFDADGGALGVDVLRDGGAAVQAICCANDLLALGALQRLAALGVDVPGEVSVAGFDDISTAALTAPSLSTVRLPLRELGRRGFEHANRVLHDDAPDPVRLPTTVVLRASTGRRPPPSGRRPVGRRRPGRPPDGRHAGGSRGPGHREQPRDRRRGRRQGRGRGRARRRPLPPLAGRRGADARPRARAGAEAEAFDADIRDGAQAEALVGRVIERFGRIDGLVNNAGRTLVGPFLETSAEDWEDVLRTDLSAAFHTSRAALPSMVERGDGAIVNVASRLGQMGIAETAAYSAAKAGLIGLTRALAREFGPRGVRVNAVAPGATITDMTTDLLDSDEGRRRLRDMPLGRFGRADEVADAVVFLLSDRASLFLGQTLNPNAGGYMP